MLRPTFKWSYVFIICICFVVLASSSANAQFTEATLHGTVRDPAGAVVVNAPVVAVNEQTGYSRSTTTNDDGLFILPELPPGAYIVTVRLSGFKTYEQSHIILNAGKLSDVSIALRVGSTSEKVDVTADKDAIPSVSSDPRLADTIVQKEIAQLPIPQRDVFFLPSLSAGATNIPGANFSYKLTNSPTVTVNGNRFRGNNYVLDGSMNTNTINEGEPAIVPSIEAVQEMQVQTGNFSSEYGRGNGAVVNMRTKSGTNEVHGKTWEYHQNAALNARNYFATQNTPQVFNQFGAQIGGPIAHNKTFYFLTYEGSRNAMAQSLAYQVETPEFRDYVLGTAPNGIAAQLLKQFPAPTPQQAANGKYLNEVDLTVPGGASIPATGTAHVMLHDYLRYDQFLSRIDHSFNGGRDILTGRWISDFERSNGATNSQITTLAEAMRGFRDPYNGIFGNLNLGEVHVFGKIINDVRFSFQDNLIDYDRPYAQYPILNIVGISAPFGDPGNGGTNNGSRIRTYELRDTMSATLGKHLLRYGIELRKVFIGLNIGPPRTGNYSFNSLLDFAQDKPFMQSLVVDPSTGSPVRLDRDYTSYETGVFLQDEWKVTSRLMLSLGVRHDYFGSPSERYDRLSSIVLGPGNTFSEQFANASIGRVSQLFSPQKTNFSPRIGLAYDPFGDGKSSIRAGYSLAYEPIHGLTLLSASTNPPFSIQAVLQPNVGIGTSILYGIPVPYNSQFKTTLNDQGGIVSPPGSPAIRISPWIVNPHLKTQYSENWFLSLQREIAKGWIVEVGYVGTNGINLERRDDVNRVNGDLLMNNGKLKRINQNLAGVTYVTNGVNSNFNAMTVEVKHQMSRTLTFQANYRWSKWLDDSSDTASSFFSDSSQGSRGTQDANCLKCERGRAEFDIPRRFTSSLVWSPAVNTGHGWLDKLAGHWQVSAVISAQSGRPFSVFCSASFQAGCDYNADGGGGIGSGYYDRPNAPAAGAVKSSFSQKDFLNGLFSPTIFPTPTPGTNGNLPRDAFRGPRQINSNLALARHFKLRERAEFQLQAQAFNALNNVNLYLPNGDLALALKPDKTFSTTSSFAKSTQAFDPRILQVGASFTF